MCANATEQATKFVARLDHQLALPLVNWMGSNGLVSAEERKRAVAEIVRHSTFAVSEVESMGLVVDDDVKAKREESDDVVAKLEPKLADFVAVCQYIQGASGEPKSFRHWVAEWNKSNEHVGLHLLDEYVVFLRVLYGRGEYSVVAERAQLALVVLDLVTDEPDTGILKQLNWALLASKMQQLTDPRSMIEASEESVSVKACQEADSVDPHLAAVAITRLEALLDTELQAHTTHGEARLLIVESKLWLLHWAVWTCFRYFVPRYLAVQVSKVQLAEQQAWSDLLECLVHERNLKLVEYYADHLTAYYSVMAIFLRRRPEHRKAVLGLALRVSHKHQDPFSAFLLAVFSDFSLPKALSLLEADLQPDFFLDALNARLRSQARYLVFETFYRMHSALSLETLASHMHMSAEDAASWIQSVAQSSRTEVTVDGDIVRLRTEQPPVREVIAQKIRVLSARAAALGAECV